MALVRYLFLGNADRSDRIVDRYVISGNPLNDPQTGNAGDSIRRKREEARTYDLLAPSEWCATDADLLESSESRPADYRPTPQVTAFLGKNYPRVDKFIHFCDIELAQDWRAQASQLASVPDAEIAALTYDAQIRHVRTAWTAFGNVFRALNLRPYGWAKYRRAWEWAIAPQTNQQPHVANEQLPPRAQRYVGVNDSFDALSTWRRDLAITYNRSFPRYALPTGPNRAAGVRIGSAASCEYAWDQSNEPACGRELITNSNGCLGPTLDVFQVWLSNDAKINSPSDARTQYRSWGASAQQWAGYRSGGADGDYDGNDGNEGWIYSTEPLKWHLDLLRSLLVELRAMDLLSLIHEVRLDVLGKNIWTLKNSGQSQAEILVSTDNLVAAHQADERSDRRKIISYLGPAAALASAIPGPGLVIGAAIGLGLAVTSLISDLVKPSVIAWDRDVLGRSIPTLEVFQIDPEAGRGATESVTRNVLPPPVAEYVQITQMPAGGRVLINGTDVTAQGPADARQGAQWIDPAHTILRVPIPASAYRITSLRVVDAAGGMRDALIGGPDGFRVTDGVAHVGYADFLPASATVRLLQPHASLSIDGLPLPRTDAVNAAGTEFRYEVPSGMTGTPPVPRVLTVTGLRGETWEFQLAIPAGQMQMLVLSPAALKTPALPQQGVVEATRQGVVVLGIPMFSVVFLDGATQGNVGGEAIGTAPNLLWFVPATVGTHMLRIVALDQSVREGLVMVSPQRIASISWDELRVTTPAATERGTLTVTGPAGWRLALALVGSSVPFVTADLALGGPSVSAWPVGQYTLGVDDLHGRIAMGTITLTAAGLAVDAEEFLTAHTGWLTVRGPARWRLAIGPVGATEPTLAADMPAEGSVSLPWPVGEWSLGIDDGVGHRAVKTITIRQGTVPLVVDARAFVAPPGQQRQVIADGEQGSNGVMILAGVVALGAVALFVGTTMLGTSPPVKAHRNPVRRKGMR